MQHAIPKGTFDILPRDPDEAWRESHLWQDVEKTIREICKVYGFREIRTPIFERTELFVRGVGEGSDIVSKEMYTFQDKGGRSLTLRPEGTASVMRAFIEKHMDQQGGLHKFFYVGPMFRYERPQAGRYRQHHQFGVESIGSALPESDVEVIALLLEFYNSLGLKNLNVLLNSVGNEETRTRFREALRSFLEPKRMLLSADSQMRLEKNVLRILDSKDPQDQELLQGAPSLLEMLHPADRDHFERVQLLLHRLHISFEVQPKLVRGLDYYNRTVFEITSGDLGAHNAVGGGGRYDGLLSLLGGPNLPAIGFGTGLERIIQTMLKQQISLPEKIAPLLFFIPIGEKAKEYCFALVFQLRRQRIPVEIDFHVKRVGHSLQLAEVLGAHYSLVLGEEELLSGQIKLKEMQTRREISLSLDQLSIFLGENLALRLQ